MIGLTAAGVHLPRYRLSARTLSAVWGGEDSGERAVASPMVAADLDGGGRFYTQVTDCDPAAIEIGTPVELTSRPFHEGGELANYFCKVRSVSN